MHNHIGIYSYVEERVFIPARKEKNKRVCSVIRKKIYDKTWRKFEFLEDLENSIEQALMNEFDE